MSEQPQHEISFYLSQPNSCPYLADRNEQKIFTYLSGHKAQMHMQLLSENGFRRSQNIIYRPSCKNCDECKSIRVVAKNYKPTKSHKRILQKNKIIKPQQIEAKATKEHYALFKKYLVNRHNEGGMADMDYADFKDMIEDTAINTSIIEYRLEINGEQKKQLVGVALIDILFDGISMVYSFFDPELNNFSLGTFMVIDNIYRSLARNNEYLYLGYWIKNSQKMSYKANFKPLEFYIEGSGWVTLNAKGE